MHPGDVAFLEEIAITEIYQNRGIGTKVIKDLLKIYKKKGFKKLMAIANLKSKAYKLYKKIGILRSDKNIIIEKEIK